MKTDQNTELEHAPAEPSEAGSMQRAGSPARLAAVVGYMDDRHELITQLAQISSMYERDSQLHNRIVKEIERIDVVVGGLVAQEHAQALRTGAGGDAP